MLLQVTFPVDIVSHGRAEEGGRGTLVQGDAFAAAVARPLVATVQQGRSALLLAYGPTGGGPRPMLGRV